MKTKTDNSSSLIIGIVIALMGAGWLFTSAGSLGALDVSNWWAFGMLIPIFYMVRSAMKARQSGENVMGYIAGAVGIFAAMLVFFGLLTWMHFPPITMLGVGVGFIADSF